MTKMALIAGALFSLCLATGRAEATVDHTYVSGKGTDTGECIDPATACRTFAYAITQTTASGEIIVIDPANYSPVTITKSISIVADGSGPAGIVLATGTAITINAGANDVVNLRGLTLEGEGSAAYGIVLNTAGALTISDCFVRHFQNTGILIAPEGVGGTTIISITTILNSVANDNGIGISLTGFAGSTKLTVRNSVANNNATGFYVYGGSMTFAGSMAAGNSEYGIFNQGRNGLTQFFSYGDNEINGNGTDISGATFTLVAKQ